MCGAVHNPQPLQEMCSQYWPASGEKKQCGKYLSVEMTEERTYVDYVHRDFKITFTDEVVSGMINKLCAGPFSYNTAN